MIKVDVQKQLGDFRLDAKFDANFGVTAIFGRSGSGKTTLVNSIAGLVTPDTGQIAVNGRVLFDSGTNVPVRQRNLGYVFQDARLFPHLSVEKNLLFGGSTAYSKVIELLGLAPILTRKPATLSGGEKQRVALGRALMSNPSMLLLDEPLAALDARRKAEVLPYLEKLRDEMQLPMIYVSHAMSEVAQLANHIVVLDQGRVVQHGLLNDVLSQPASMSLLSMRDVGAVIEAPIASHDHNDHLTVLSVDGETLSVPGIFGAVGHVWRLRVPAHDIILTMSKTAKISERTVLPVQITAIEDGLGPGVAVGLRVGQASLLAWITKASLRDMDLKIGDKIFAIIKATAIAAENIRR